MAHSWGVDYIEPDVVMTKDNKLIVMHDIYLDLTTDVRKKFSKRARKDRRFYVVDFTLAEIKMLSLEERFDPRNHKMIYPDRFPQGTSEFKVPTLEEYIQLVQGLNKTRHKSIGIYLEIKKPVFHLTEGKDITLSVLALLKKYHYLKSSNKSQIIIQCFEPKTLKRLKRKLNILVPLVQLIGENSWNESDVDYKKMRTAIGLAKVAQYATGIGPYLKHIYRQENGRIVTSGLVNAAHLQGLVVHPYTHRIDDLPPGFASSKELLGFLLHTAKVDGIFSDFADQAILAR
jgi:glycerophosphoryl diester phosphodiesterase